MSRDPSPEASRFTDSARAAAPRPPAHPLVASLAPALDMAFGLEDPTLFPEAIVALIAALEAGPLGADPALPAHTATSGLLEAA